MENEEKANMGFITKEDFDLLAKWGGKKYNKDNPEHQEATEKLREVYEKIATIGFEIKKSSEIWKDFIMYRRVTTKNQTFIPYNWGRFYPTEDKRLCITIGMRAYPPYLEYRVKIGINKIGNGDLTEESAAYEKLRDENYHRIVHDFDASEICKKDKEGLIKLTKKYLKELNKEFDWVYKSIFGSSKKLNTILYGPPGTGKTYTLQKEYFEEFTSRKTKEEFIKSKVEIENLSWLDSVTLATLLLNSDNVTVPELIKHPVIKHKASLSSSQSIRANCWAILQQYTPHDSKNVNYTKRPPAIFWKNDDSSWKIDKPLTKETLPEIYSLWEEIQNYKPTETDEQRYEFVTFHQSFSYEDFIEGIKPKLDDEDETNELSYTIEEGVFLRLAKKAALYPEKDWALFIDEINRGNVASIFGELITLIEDDKRKGKDNELIVTLPYSKEKFSVPKNLYIIGTMNTADRSIETLDTALRRRFSFIEKKPHPELLTDTKKADGNPIVVEGIELKRLLATINNRLLVLLGKDYLIGHSYFMNIEKFDELRNTFKNKIIPLLEEYFYNDREKIGMVLGSGFVQSLNDGDKNKVTFAIGFKDSELLDDTQTYVIKDPLKVSLDDFIKIYSN